MIELLLFLTGIIVGGTNAIAGGGMLIGLPIMIATGMAPLTASVTGIAVSGPGQLASAIGYRKFLRRVPKRFALLIIPLVIGGAGGSLLLRNTSADNFAEIIPFLVLFGVLFFALQPYIHFHLREHLRGKHRTITPLLLVAVALLPLGVYGGYFGAGIGFMMLAFLSFARLPELHTINAMKNVGILFLSVTSLCIMYSAHIIDWRVGGIMAAGSIIGGYYGARLGQRLSSHWLRITVIVIGFGSVIYLTLQNL
jgi:uncharacterized protein